MQFQNISVIQNMMISAMQLHHANQKAMLREAQQEEQRNWQLIVQQRAAYLHEQAERKKSQTLEHQQNMQKLKKLTEE